LLRAGAYRREWGLTGRQERALRVAFQIGYFDYPRKASLATLAGRLGVSRSTALELLRKGTTKLAAQRFFGEPSLGLLP
jgi:predicted DNA binding protein